MFKAGELKRGEEADAVRAPAQVEATYRAMISAFIALELSVHAEEM